MFSFLAVPKSWCVTDSNSISDLMKCDDISAGSYGGRTRHIGKPARATIWHELETGNRRRGLVATGATWGHRCRTGRQEDFWTSISASLKDTVTCMGTSWLSLCGFYDHLMKAEGGLRCKSPVTDSRPKENDLTFHPAVRCHSQVRNLFTVTRDQNLNSISKEHNVLLQDSNLQGLSQIRNYCVNQEKPLFCFVPTLPAFPLLHDLVPDNHVIMVFKFLPAHLHQPMLEAAKLTTLPSMVWVSRDFTVKHLT